jgi:hypothetical protein
MRHRQTVVSACGITLALIAGAAMLRLQASNRFLAMLVPTFALHGRPALHVETLLASAVAAPGNIDSSLQDLIRRLPKAELHIHIEGTLEASMMMRFAKRNNVSLPYANLAEAEAARWALRLARRTLQCYCCRFITNRRYIYTCGS